MKTTENVSRGGGQGVRLSVRVIGPLVVRRGEHTLTAKELGGPRQRQILEILLLQLGTPVSKRRLVDLVWGDRAPAAALANLESYVSVLRRHLQPGEGRGGVLRTTNGGYVMDGTLVDLDLDRFDLLLETARRSLPQEAYPVLRRALGLASAPLLENELPSEWTESRRSLHAARVAEARMLAAEAALALDLPSEAAEHGRRVLAHDPLDERAWAVLVLGLEGSGRPVEGLQAYDRCRRILDGELGCAPSATLRRAYERMLRATAASESDLGQVLSALLVLHGPPGGRPNVGTLLPAAPAPLAREEAATVIRAFLGRSLVPAA